MEENKEIVVEKISEQDKLSITLGKLEKEKVYAQAEKAIAQNDLAEQKFKNLVLMLYLKYKLDMADQIQDDGTIVRKQ